MRHHDSNRKFGRERDQRRALLKSLARNLFKHGRIKTTLAKAKELRPRAEKMLTRSIKAGKPARKTDRTSGYTRIIKTSARKSDGAAMAIIEFV